ncbi:MAG: LptF/LptG family permease [Bacteroidota bacterium]
MTSFLLLPEDFTRYLNQKEMMATPEMMSFVRRERDRGVGNTKIYEVEMQRRTAEPFTILILTIIGVAVAARKVRGGMGIHLAMGIALGGIFIFLSKFSITFSTNDNLPAALGVWIPNFIFAGVAFVLVQRAQK